MQLQNQRGKTFKKKRKSTSIFKVSKNFKVQTLNIAKLEFLKYLKFKKFFKRFVLKCTKIFQKKNMKRLTKGHVLFRSPGML